MNIRSYFSGMFLAAAVILAGGCGLFDSSDPNKSPNNTVPPAIDNDPNLVIDGTDSEGFTPGAGNIPAQAGEFTPIPNQSLPTVYFAYDRDIIGTSEKAKLDTVAAYMQKSPEICLIIEGHCDDRGSTEYNRSLGERRAISVKNYLMQSGISEDRFKTLSYGEDRPAVPGTDPVSRGKNRRAELIPAKRN